MVEHSGNDDKTERVPWLGSCEEYTVYKPKKSPGFAAWVNAFSYQDGSYGISFDEVTEENNPIYKVPLLEFAEAAGVPVSYGSVEAGSAKQRSWRVFMRTYDGKNFIETGRCPRCEGSFGAAGFPDGRILGFDVPRYNEKGTGWSDFLRVRESYDGGKTWKDLHHLLEGCAPYLWRVRRLKDGKIVILASLYGTPWGPDKPRATRNTMLPGESYDSKIQTLFLTTYDGINFTGPHYILPGIGAHEFDFVELPDGRLLFIAGDVQGTPVGRQFVQPIKNHDGWINGTLHTIHGGAPHDPKKNPQGGIIPETIVWDKRQECIVGYRRNKCFSISNDYGENWVQVDMPRSLQLLYQPVLVSLEDGSLELFGHVGGDLAFGQRDSCIIAQKINLQSVKFLPKPCSLEMKRLMAEDKSHYINAFQARLSSEGKGLSGQKVIFRLNPYWNDDGSINTKTQDEAEKKITAVTDKDGYASVRAKRFSNRGDIHLSYTIDVIFPGSGALRSASGPSMTVLALTPYRRNEFPYDAYFANGTLYLSPGFISDFPKAKGVLEASIGEDTVPEKKLGKACIKRLENSGVIKKHGDHFYWIKSIHAPRRLDDVKIMLEGDWYR